MTTAAPHRRRPGSPAPARRHAAAATALVLVALAATGCSAAGASDDPPRAAAVPGDGLRASSAGEAAASPAAPPLDDPAEGLDPELLARFEAARAAAAAEDVELRITSGRRSAAEQQRLVDEAVAEHGVPEAYRWVLPPERSAHVQGLAVDVGPTPGAFWLAERAVEFGLCQTYANEVWHFEKLPEGAAECPAQHPDSSWGWDQPHDESVRGEPAPG